MRKLTETAEAVDIFLEKKDKGFILENALHGTMGEFSVKIYNKGEDVVVDLLIDGKVKKSKSGTKDGMVALYETLFDAVESELNK
jgi:hypothetical protein